MAFVNFISNQSLFLQYVLGFPRDATGHFIPGQKSSLVLLSLYPRLKKFACPTVALFRDKSIRKNSGTNSSVPGDPRTKSLPDLPKKLQKILKNGDLFFFFKICNFLLFFPSILHPVLGRDGTGCQNPVLDGPVAQEVKILSWPIPWQDFELVPLSLCPGTMEVLLSFCPAGQENPVLLETLVCTPNFERN